MRSFFAKQGNAVHSGGWLSVVLWARVAVKQDEIPVQILSARAGEKFARVIAEISLDGEKLIRDGRIIKVKFLRG